MIAPTTVTTTEPEDMDSELDAYERLIAWQFVRLLEDKFTIEQAQELIKIRHFSWHDAHDLLAKGATHEWIVRYFT